jgi:hypothetical protein
MRYYISHRLCAIFQFASRDTNVILPANKTHIPIERYNVSEEGNTQTKNEEQCIRKLL